jgi:hypothetical protein
MDKFLLKQKVFYYFCVLYYVILFLFFFKVCFDLKYVIQYNIHIRYTYITLLTIN